MPNRTPERSRVRVAVVVLAVVLGGIAAAPAARAETSQTAKKATYTVKDGDTLSGIGARFGVSASAIASANSLASPDRLSIGMKLTIPTRAAKADATATGASPGRSKTQSKTQSKAKAKAKSTAVKPGRYVVGEGDTVIGLARAAGISPRSIIAANDLTPPSYMIRSGATITIPSGSGATKARTTRAGGSTTSTGRAAPVAGSTYRVRGGDTVSSIASRSGVGAASIITANRLAPPRFMIRDGQSLQIPAKGQIPKGGPQAKGATPAATPPGPGRNPTKAQVGAALEENARRYGLPVDLVKGVAWQESGWRQDVVSSVGAVGVMQLMPGTAGWIGDNLVGRRINANNYRDNVQGGAAYLDYLLGQVGQDDRLALASYYQGLSAVKRKGLYKESERYVASVQSHRKKYR